MRANARSSEHIRQIINTFEHTGLVADSDSENSRRIQNIANIHREIITESAQTELDKVVLFGIDAPQCDAFPVYYNDTPCIIFFDGLLQLVRFNTDLHILLSLLREKIPEQKIEIDGEIMPVELAISMAGHVVLTESIDTGHQLMDIAAMFGKNAIKRSEYGYGAAIIFYVLHELGHIVFGHSKNGFVSERMSIETAIKEELNQYQKMELEADRYALDSIHVDVRNPIISSIVFALGPFAFLETFKGRLNTKHPLTANRISALASRVDFPDEPELAGALLSVVEAEIERFWRLAEDRRLNEGNIQHRIQKNMTLPVAYDVMNTIGRHIRDNFGVLDF